MDPLKVTLVGAEASRVVWAAGTTEASLVVCPPIEPEKRNVE